MYARSPSQFDAVADPMKETVSGAFPDVGVAEASQARTQGAETVTVPVCEQVLPSMVTMRAHSKLPELV
jgi:hypothetical protein